MTSQAPIDLDQAPVVLIHRRRSTVLLLIVACAGLWGACRLASREGAAFQVWDAISIAGWTLVLLWSLALLVRPMRVTLAREGLRHENWPRTRFWRWGEIADVKGTPSVVTFLASGRRVKLRAPDVGAGGVGLALAMEEAKARWAPGEPGSA